MTQKMVGTQAPGFFRLMVGDLEVTALSDGHFCAGPHIFKGLEEEKIRQAIRGSFQPETESGVRTSINAYLINTGDNLILIDSGSESEVSSEKKAGNIVANLRASGYKPEDVDTIMLTHLHADHIGGLIQGGDIVFPNATIYVSKNEIAFWNHPEVMEKASPEQQAVIRKRLDTIALYETAGRLQRYGDGETILSKIEAIAAPGHTPGHTAYLFGSKGQKLLIWGDIVHNVAVQLHYPEVFLVFDYDWQQAIVTRRRLLAMAASEALWVGGAHLPFPGLGHIQTNGDVYNWVPAQFGPVQ